jgi:transposase
MNNALYLNDWTVTAVEATDAAYKVTASYDITPTVCPKCGCIGKLYKHGPKTVEYTDAPVHGRHCVISVQTNRMKCMECESTFMPDLPDMDDRRQVTKRCVNYVERQIQFKTNSQIARETGLNEKTVRQILKAAADRREELHRAKLYAPLVLGIDELRLDGKLRTVFTDGAYRRVLDILPSQDKRVVNHWLSWLPGRERVRIVTTDMYGPYKDVALSLLPNAMLIVDRWHVQKKLNEALDSVRVRLRNAAKTKRAKQAIMRKRKLLQMSRHKLRPHTLALLEAWLANNPVLKDAWEAKEAFYDVWESKTILEAETAFLRVRDALPDSVKEEFGEPGFSGTIFRWWEHVFPFFEYRYTNAYTEASNGISKMINRAGRGYKFDQIRARVLAYRRLTGNRICVCETCLKRFEPEDGMFFMFGMCMCPECAESHIWQFIREKGHSTLQSE